MTCGTYRDWWLAHVHRAGLVTEQVCAALLALADDMTDDGLVYVTRWQLADRLNISESAVSRRLAAARAAGLLALVAAARNGLPAVYLATIPPTPQHVERTSPWASESDSRNGSGRSG